MADLNDFIGKRILVKKVGGDDVFETEITEVSPSGEYMKVADGWLGAKEWEFAEELKPIEPGEEKPTKEEQAD